MLYKDIVIPDDRINEALCCRYGYVFFGSHLDVFSFAWKITKIKQLVFQLKANIHSTKATAHHS